jgi:hypothetical protein
MCRPVDVWFDFIKAWIRKDLCNSRTESDSAVQHCTLYTAGHSCNWKVCMPALATAFDPKQTKETWLSKIRPAGKMKTFKLWSYRSMPNAIAIHYTYSKLHCILSFRKRTNLWLYIRTIFVRNLSFLYSWKYNIFFSKISTVSLECLCMWVFIFSFFEILYICFQEPGAVVLMC